MKARILIVDDNDAIRKALTALLETHADWEVCGQAKNGEEGVAKAAELKPDLIILDLVMPVMDGLQTSRAIAKILPNAPILLHTQHYSKVIELEAKKFGVRQVVAKSHPAEALFKAIESLLSPIPAVTIQDSAEASAFTAAAIAESSATTESAKLDTVIPPKQSQTFESSPSNERAAPQSGSAVDGPAINGPIMDGPKPE